MEPITDKQEEKIEEEHVEANPEQIQQ